MKKKKLHLLILEDNPADAELAIKELKKEGFMVEWSLVDTEEAFRDALNQRPEIILADYTLHSFDGLSALKIKQEIVPEIPLVILSGNIEEEVAIECIKSGATDYVLKDKLFRLGPVVKRSLAEAHQVHRERSEARESLQESEERYRNLIESTYDLIQSVALDGRFLFVNRAWQETLGYILRSNYLTSIYGKLFILNLFPIAKKSFPRS
jgi:DNA-binding NtrC family response regulator